MVTLGLASHDLWRMYSVPFPRPWHSRTEWFVDSNKKLAAIWKNCHELFLMGQWWECDLSCRVAGNSVWSVIPCGMWVPVAVWQPSELIYTCYVYTHLIFNFHRQARPYKTVMSASTVWIRFSTTHDCRCRHEACQLGTYIGLGLAAITSVDKGGPCPPMAGQKIF